MPRAAVRVLHAGHGDVGSAAPAGQPESHRSRNPPGSRRQHLPLYGLPQHRARDRASRRPRLTPFGDPVMTDMSSSPIGKALLRREDKRFLTGTGQYTDDVAMPD